MYKQVILVLLFAEYIEFWLNSIYEYTQHEEVHSRARSNVILVGTFADKIKEVNDYVIFVLKCVFKFRLRTIAINDNFVELKS